MRFSNVRYFTCCVFFANYKKKSLAKKYIYVQSLQFIFGLMGNLIQLIIDGVWSHYLNFIFSKQKISFQNNFASRQLWIQCNILIKMS